MPKFIVPIDSSEIARHSQGIPYEDITYRSKASIQFDMNKVLEIMDKLPPREQDIIQLHFIQHKKQVELAKIFKITQAAVSYRINRAIQRIRFLLDLPKDLDEMDEDLREIFKEEFDYQVMILMYKHTCQSEVARCLGSTQCYVRHRFFKNIDLLEKEAGKDQKFKKYFVAFSMIKQNFNILRQVDLPHWNKTNNFI